MKITNKIRCILCFFLLCGAGYAQVSIDPLDTFYTTAESWEVKGVVKELPQVKPYPVFVIQKILSEAMQSDSFDEMKKAEELGVQLFGKTWHAGVAAGGDYKYTKTGDGSTAKNGQFSFEPSVAGDFTIGKMFSAGCELGLFIHPSDTDETSLRPVYGERIRDIAGNSFAAGNYDFSPDLNAGFAFGKENMYLTAGMNRSGFGPFPDSDILLSPQAYHAHNMTLVYDGKYADFTQYASVINAGKNNGSSDDYELNKIFLLHSIRLPVFTPKFIFSYYEAVVYKARIDPLYMVPFASYPFMNFFDTSSDNTAAGFTVQIKPVKCLELNADILIDDIDLKQTLKLKLNSNRCRSAFKAGLLYSPLDSSCELLTFDYTAVTPYTYSYSAYADSDTYDTAKSLWYRAGTYFTADTYNYSSFTNRGIQTGSTLAPDSDCINLKLEFKPLASLRIATVTTFMRHGNACDSFSDSEKELIFNQNKAAGKDVYATDGSASGQTEVIGTDGTAEDIDTAWDEVDFLRQSHIMYVCRSGVAFEYDFRRTEIGTLSVSAGYMFELIHNAGVDCPMLSASGHYNDASYTWKNAYSEWEKNLHNEYNSYLTVSVKYAY